MKRSLVIFLVILSSNHVFGQINNDEVNKVIGYFSQCISFEPIEENAYKDFSSEIIQKVFSESSYDKLILVAGCVTENSFGKIFFIKVRFQGYDFSDTYALLINDIGSYRKKSLGMNISNLEETDNIAETSMVNDTVIQVRQCTYEHLTGRELARSYEYFIVRDFGIYEMPMVECSNGREYPNVSRKALQVDSITNMPKAELDIMRNEIFADHGYKFKTKKWHDYFIKQSWYDPRFDDVNDKLSVIEKINVQTILKASKNKK